MELVLPLSLKNLYFLFTILKYKLESNTTISYTKKEFLNLQKRKNIEFINV